MDMNANYGGFAAALSNDPVWIMNVVPYTMSNTLPVIYDRGLLGSYHDWLVFHSKTINMFLLFFSRTHVSLIYDETESIQFSCCRCEPFSTYPRSYDLLHAFHLIMHYESRNEDCLLEDIMLEMDRIIRPQVTISF